VDTRYKHYEVFCLVDPSFYDSPLSANPADYGFEPASRAVPEGWARIDKENWISYRPVDAPMPWQGWKIHASACLENAEKIVSAVWDYCVPRGIPFKFLAGRHILIMSNSKQAGRGGSGKLVTIYPVDEAELELALKELGEVLNGEPGPYILSDLRWGAGPLYVRYGGFLERFCMTETGELESAIEDDTGKLVPDRREPTFYVPPWVTLPDFLAPHLEARNSTKVDAIPYSIERALHFSNGGGIYYGRDRRTGEEVVLREARPHAGLDVDGADAVTRLQREKQVLERLQGLDSVPGLRDYFTLGEHHFLAQDFVEGDTLNSEFVLRYPLTSRAVDDQAVAEHTEWAVGVIEQVERAIAVMHGRGVVFGDLHPMNIMIRPDGSVVLIDYEIASFADESRGQTLAAPGFAAPPGTRGFDIDTYALACLRLYLFSPLTSLMTLGPGKAEQLAGEIAARFPVPDGFIEGALTVLAPTTEPTPRLPELTPDREGWERARDSMAEAILASATPERDDRLFPGDIQQFRVGGLGLAYGAAGVLYALSATGARREPEHEAWFVSRALRQEQHQVQTPGLYDGLHGVAFVLDHLGYRSEAISVLDRCSGLDGSRLGLDLFSGLAGIGMTLAHFAETTGDSGLRDAAVAMGRLVADRLGDEDSVPETSGGTTPLAGLMRGSSGPALLFVRLHELTGDPGFLDAAAVALRQDLRRCVWREDGTLQVNEGWRVLPYLESGSVGIAMALEDYLAHRPDDDLTESHEALRAAGEPEFYILSNLFNGRAGILLALSRRHGAGRAAGDPLIQGHVRRLAWHALSYQGHLAFPGEQLLRLSMDLATGTAGVLLALGAALHDQPVGLPFLGPRRGTTRVLAPPIAERR
jgi:tRNA A-37 threonylcarbamoyl transferase component Bud32